MHAATAESRRSTAVLAVLSNAAVRTSSASNSPSVPAEPVEFALASTAAFCRVRIVSAVPCSPFMIEYGPVSVNSALGTQKLSLALNT